MKGFGILRIINDNVTKGFSRVDQLERRKKNKIELCLHDPSRKYWSKASIINLHCTLECNNKCCPTSTALMFWSSLFSIQYETYILGIDKNFKLAINEFPKLSCKTTLFHMSAIFWVPWLAHDRDIIYHTIWKRLERGFPLLVYMVQETCCQKGRSALQNASRYQIELFSSYRYSKLDPI